MRSHHLKSICLSIFALSACAHDNHEQHSSASSVQSSASFNREILLINESQVLAGQVTKISYQQDAVVVSTDRCYAGKALSCRLPYSELKTCSYDFVAEQKDLMMNDKEYCEELVDAHRETADFGDVTGLCHKPQSKGKRITHFLEKYLCPAHAISETERKFEAYVKDDRFAMECFFRGDRFDETVAYSLAGSSEDFRGQLSAVFDMESFLTIKEGPKVVEKDSKDLFVYVFLPVVLSFDFLFEQMAELDLDLEIPV